MGRSFLHRCDACGYGAEVSGGPDRGRRAATRTVSCGECEALCDTVEEWFAGFSWGPTGTVPLRCPKDEAHTVNAWASGDPCPRCGEPIARGRATEVWN